MPRRGEMPFRERTKSKEKNPLISGICSVFNISAFWARPLVFYLLSLCISPTYQTFRFFYRLTHVLLAILKVWQSGDKMEKWCTQQDLLEPLIVTYRSNWDGGKWSSLGTHKISSVGVYFHLWLQSAFAGEGRCWVAGCVCGARAAVLILGWSLGRENRDNSRNAKHFLWK